MNVETMREVAHLFFLWNGSETQKERTVGKWERSIPNKLTGNKTFVKGYLSKGAILSDAQSFTWFPPTWATVNWWKVAAGCSCIWQPKAAKSN